MGRFSAPDTLGVAAESVLLAIFYLAKHHGTVHDPRTLPGADVPMLLHPHGIAATSPLVSLQTTRYALLKAAGMPTDRPAYQRLKHILFDLGTITMVYTNLVTGENGNDFLMFWESQPQTDRIIVQMNWRIAGAIFGTYLRAMIDFNERNVLHSDPAKSMHRWLSAHLWPGKSEWILWNTLIRHIWPTDDDIATTRRVRLHRLKTRIIPELQNLPGWRITGHADGMLVQRLQRPDP